MVVLGPRAWPDVLSEVWRGSQRGTVRPFIGGEKANKYRQFFGIVPGMGGSKICLCVAFFSGEKRETQKQNSQEVSGKCRDNPGTISGQSREDFAYVFPCLFVFFWPSLYSFPMRWEKKMGS